MTYEPEAPQQCEFCVANSMRPRMSLDRALPAGGGLLSARFMPGRLREHVLLGVQGCDLCRRQPHKGVAQQLGPAQPVVGVLAQQALAADPGSVYVTAVAGRRQACADRLISQHGGPAVAGLLLGLMLLHAANLWPCMDPAASVVTDGAGLDTRPGSMSGLLHLALCRVCWALYPHKALELIRHISGPVDGLVDNVLDESVDVVGEKRWFAVKQLEEDDAQGPQVGLHQHTSHPAGAIQQPCASLGMQVPKSACSSRMSLEISGPARLTVWL